MVQRLYPTLVKKMEDKKAGEETRLRAVARIGQIASLGPEALVKREAEKKLLEIWFSDDTEVERPEQKGRIRTLKLRRKFFSRSSRNVSCHKVASVVPKSTTRFIVKSEPQNAFCKHPRIV